MTPNKTFPLFQVGERVKIRHWDWRARIVEFRGPLGPGGMFVYRVRIPDKPKPRYIELCEDQLIAIPTTTEGEANSSAKPRRRGKKKKSEDEAASDSRA